MLKEGEEGVKRIPADILEDEGWEEEALDCPPNFQTSLSQGRALGCAQFIEDGSGLMR